MIVYYVDNETPEERWFRNLKDARKKAKDLAREERESFTVDRIVMADMTAKDLLVTVLNGPGFAESSDEVETWEWRDGRVRQVKS